MRNRFISILYDRWRLVLNGLDMAKTCGESIPQFATQWWFWFKDTAYSDPAASRLQYISLTITMISIVRSTLNFILLHRRRNFISRHFPTVASLIPIALLIITCIGKSALNFQALFFLEGVKFFVNTALCVFHLVFVSLVISLPWRPSLTWRLIRTLVFASSCGGALAIIIYEMETDTATTYFVIYFFEAQPHFHFYYVCCGANFLMGVLILSSKELAAVMFNPFIMIIHKGLKFVVDNFCCFIKLRLFVNQMLDGMLKGGGRRLSNDAVEMRRRTHIQNHDDDEEMEAVEECGDTTEIKHDDVTLKEGEHDNLTTVKHNDVHW